MSKNPTIPFDFSQVPPSWQLCFNAECPRHAECLHFLAGEHTPDSLTWGPAVYPTACRNKTCPHFKATRVIHAAYGMKPLYRHVLHEDYPTLRAQIMDYLGSYRTYYRYNRGERLLTPEQQAHILAFVRRYTSDDDLHFEHYHDLVDFT